MDQFAMAVGYCIVCVAFVAFVLLMCYTFIHTWRTVIFLHRANKAGIVWKTSNPLKRFWFAFTFDSDCIGVKDHGNVFFPGREWKD